MTQAKIDFERGTQLAMLRDTRLPAVTVTEGTRSVTIPEATIRHVLRAIDDHARGGHECFATQATLAMETGLSRRSVIRALVALVQLSLVTCERRKIGSGRMTVNHHRIVWTELAALRARQDRDQSATVAPDQSAIAKYQSATCADQSATVARSKCHRGTFLEPPMKRTEPPPPNPPAGVAVAAEENSWKSVEAELLAAGVAHAARVVRHAQECRIDAAEVRAVLAEYAANRGRLRPGAIVWRIRHGVWPAEIRTTVGAAKRDDAAVRQRHAANLNELIRAARRAGIHDDAELRRRAREHIPLDVCETAGW